MKCAVCESQLHYGDKFCNNCGEKVAKGAFEEDYTNTIWGKVDKVSDWWETLTFKKFLDHWITKTIILLLVLAWGFFDAYTDLTNIKFLESESYKIEYNEDLDEYYIRTEEEAVSLNLYVPRHCEKITIEEYEGDNVVSTREMLYEEYKENAITIERNKSDSVTISSIKNEKVTDLVKFCVTE